jgi:hypothetical protein
MKAFRANQGEKCKVYQVDRVVGYGEVIGIGEDRKVLLLWRPDFEKLKLSEFDRFPQLDKVRFIFKKP